MTAQNRKPHDGRETNRREKVVAAARRRFTIQGYDGTAIGEIAGDLDISKAAVGYYFPSKEAFIDEFLAPFLDELEERVEGAEGTHGAVSGYLEVVTSHHDVAVWMDTDPVLQNHSVHGARLVAINEYLINVIMGRRRSGDARARALTVLGGVWRPVRELSFDQLVEHHRVIVDAAIAGSG